MDKNALLAELEGFVDSPRLATTSQEVGLEGSVPERWLSILQQDLDGKRRALLADWAGFATKVPTAEHFVRTQLQDVLILFRGQSPSLLYFYTADQGDINFFEGRPPLKETVPEQLGGVWPLVPPDLRRFYSEVHNGWTFLPSNSMGPLPLKDWSFLSDDRFDLDDDTVVQMPMDPQQVVTVFHNGAGDYLCLDFGALDNDGFASGLIYWHENPTEPDFVDFWGVMSTWLGIFLENADQCP